MKQIFAFTKAYDLRLREENEQAQSTNRVFKLTSIALTLAASVLLVACGNSEKMGELSTKTRFLLSETEFDFGTIKQSGGIVTHDFEFEYLANKPIKIISTPSSCACTEGEISSQEFENGDTGTLTVKFDPNLHEEPEGKFFKTVTIMTDPELEKQPEVKVWIEIDLDLGPEAFKLKELHDDDDIH